MLVIQPELQPTFNNNAFQYVPQKEWKYVCTSLQYKNTSYFFIPHDKMHFTIYLIILTDS